MKNVRALRNRKRKQPPWGGSSTLRGCPQDDDSRPPHKEALELKTK